MTSENERLKYFRNELKLTQAELSKELSIKQASLSDVERGKVKVSANLLSSLMSKYRLNPFWLVEGKGVMQLTEDQFKLLTSNIIYSVKDSISTVSEQKQQLNGFGKNLLISKDQYDNYLNCVLSKTSIGDLSELLQTVKLPGLQGNGRTFELMTDAMAPNLNRGDYAVCSPSSIDDLLSHKNYFFISKKGVVVGKGRLKSNNKVLKISPDNKKSGNPVSIAVKEVLEVWEIKMKLTSILTDPYEERFKTLEELILKKKKRK